MIQHTTPSSQDSGNITLDSMLSQSQQSVKPATLPTSTAPGIAGGLGSYQKKSEEINSQTINKTGNTTSQAWGWKTSTSRAVIIITGVIGSICWYLLVYVTEAARTVRDPLYDSHIQRVTTLDETINELVPLNDKKIYATQSLLSDDASDRIIEIINSPRLNYIHKRDLTYQAVQSLSQHIIDQKNQIDALKSTIAEFGFYPEEISLLLNTDTKEVSLQESLLSLETIKFATALKVFSLLDSFMTPVTRQNNISRSYADQQMRLFIERGEVDIANYLQTCRHNPFESVRNNCNVIKDFENYFVYQEQEESFDTVLFKNILQFAEQKIEEEDFPSLSLAFDRFDPTSQKLSFTAGINTTSYDRAQLKAAGVLSPHVFVVTNLVNLLKQSKFVLGESININKLNVERRQITIGGIIEEIHSSELRFSLPLQKSNQREIFDYVFQERFELTPSTFTAALGNPGEIDVTE